MFTRIDIAVMEAIRGFGYDVRKMGTNKYRFLKGRAKGEITIAMKSPNIGDMAFKYENTFEEKKEGRAEFYRNRGTNALKPILGDRFFPHYKDPKQFGVSSFWTVYLEEDNTEEVCALVRKCISVAESAYAVLDSELYYRNDVSRALLETKLKKKLNSSRMQSRQNR